jgi:hypothetical protein
VSVVLAIVGLVGVPRLAAAQGYGPAEPDMLSGWRQVRMDGLTVIGTARAPELQQVANGISTFRSALTSLIPNLRLSGPLPTFVVVLKDFEQFKRYQPRDSRGRRFETVASYLNIAADANYLVFPYVRGEVGSSLIYHEYTHYLIRQNAPAPVPLWLEEGLAEFNSTFRPEFGDGSLLGAAPPDHVRVLKQEPYVHLRHVVSLRSAGQIVQSGRPGVFYAEAWALVHYITMGRKNPVPEPLSVYLTTLAATGSQDNAFKTAFGVDIDGMDRELQSYVRHFSFRTVTVPRTASPRSERVEPIPEADARELEESLFDGREAPEDVEGDLRPF